MPDRLSRIAAESKALLLRLDEFRERLLADAPKLDLIVKLDVVQAQANTIDKIASMPQPMP